MKTIDRKPIDEPFFAGDALARHALDFASAGLVTVPIVTHLYSVAVLLRLRLTGRPVSDRGRAEARQAWRLDLAILGASALCAGIFLAVWAVWR